MKVTYQALLLTAVAFGFGACSVDTPWGAEGEGGINLRLSASADVKDAIPMLRSEAPVLEAPDAEDFSVSLTNLATSEVKTWDKLADFRNQKSHATGAYTLTAFYGDPDEEGFEKPYFTGEAEVQVLEARQTEVAVTAQLAHSMVSVDYTDRFRAYFPDYSVTAHSEGHSYIEFAKDETRPAFIIPGEVALTVSVTNPSGKTATIQPASFPAAARYHYHVTFDVNSGTSGDAQLQIIFDDNLTQEDVTIELTDELFSSPAPSVTPSGFTDGQTLELLSGSNSATPLKFDVIARGGISSAKLSISGDGLTLPFGNEVELANASAQTQEQLKAYGINALGLFKNPQTLASVDITDLPKHLPDGKFMVSLVVKDPYTRISEPATLNISTVPVELTADDGTSVFNSNQASLTVAYNGAEPEKNVSFKAMSKTGVYKDCEVLSCVESSATRSFEVKNYIFTISLPDTDRASIPVKVYFGGVEKQTVEVSVVIPEYSWEADMFAGYAKLKLNPKNSSDLAAVANCVKVLVNGKVVSEDNINRNASTGILTVTGLTPATSYTIGTTLTGNAASDTQTLATESEVAVPNGNFSTLKNTINEDLQIGGTYQAGLITYSNWAKVNVNEPENWASINAKTFYQVASAKNSWFTVVSTYVENGQAVIRSVGYDHNGIVPDRTGKFTSTTYYNTTVPSISSRAAGELFLGSYSYDGSDHRVEGIEFASRPKGISFEYSYAPTGSDSGMVSVEVLAADGTVIATSSRNLTESSSMKTETIALAGYPFGKKAASIRVGFKSSAANFSLTTPSGGNLKEWSGTLPVSPYKHWLDDNSFHTFSSGSVLRVANVKVVY
ncbi:MAG: DUF4493 domain-containing protein [Muribaculaceae bacterium]|nr:DUF4493 domain-containing protein [Muribaculaceae bacterium]